MIRHIAAALALILSMTVSAAAQQTTTAESREAEGRAAWAEAAKVAKLGPAAVTLVDQGTLQLPPETAFLPLPEAARLARAMGNQVGPEFLGLVVSKKDHWVAYLSFIKEGYVEDGDAKDWQADELLESLRKGTEEGNQDRRARGFAPLTITGWIQPPAYDATTHRLLWSLGARAEGQPLSKPQSVNYNTYVLGRDGYFSLDFVTSSDQIEAQKPLANTLLAGMTFNEGKRYEDFNRSTDRVAAYGLAALVGGVVLKKVGLFALAAAFFAKFAKAGILLVVGLLAAARKLFRRKSSADAPS